MMSTKSIKLSSDGLKNIVPSACGEESQFSFVFGEKKIKMNSIFAQFISPAVSRLIRSDPTITELSYDGDDSFSSVQFKKNLSDDVLSLLTQISSGYTIEVDSEQSIKLRMIAILLDNEELFKKLTEVFPTELNDRSIDLYLQDLQFCNSQYKQKLQSCSFNCFTDEHIIEYIASHFYSIDEDKLLQLPRPILYTIITHKKLKLKNEDSLFSFIQKIFSNENYDLEFDEDEEEDDRFEDSEEISILSFYEAIDFSSLSPSKFQEFVENFKSSKMTKTLWRKLYPCFYTNYTKTSQKYSDRYLSKDQLFEYKNDGNAFNGIIHYLSEECGGNVSDKGVVKVTSSPTNGNDVEAKYVVDFEDQLHYFQSKNEPNSWIKYEFVNAKVKPSHYSIKTRPDGGKGDNHPKNWVIEGSNTDNGFDWKILDSRNEVTELDDGNKCCTFNVQLMLNDDESYRFLRLRQTGPNTQNGNYYFLTLAGLEFFGVLYSK